MCGCTGGVSIYLLNLPYCYNVFLRVHFSKSVRVREWGCLCLCGLEWLAFLLSAGRLASVQRVGADFASYFRLADRGRQFAVLRMVGWCALCVYRMWFAFG